MELKGTKTEKNLMEAFAGESQARNKYTFFASMAKKEGYEQLAAICAPLEPAVIIAGAGSGKTTVMAARVVWLVGTGQVLPEEVGYPQLIQHGGEVGSDWLVAQRLPGIPLSRAWPELSPMARRDAVHQIADRLKAGQQFAMYLMWYGLGRTWIENVRINYSTVILGLRTNVWTAIIVFVLGCILFVVLYQYGPDPKAQSRGLAAVTADELERQSIEEEQLRQKKQTNRTK